ncbi:polyprenyl synthetase family protein [Fodinicola acaciae]|uniref:polyprenyl synthetase family protein n=1 Tax=Fodinicola acaciae TaxID=2681555 RepID=UPI0013CF7646|nr:polyprenyl synthetase family protein [Fodinicola acaciae]
MTFATLVSDRIDRLAGELAQPARQVVQDLASRQGKGLRRTLLQACAGPVDQEAVVRAATVVELVHLASLLHDDVVDRAPVRRRRPAAYTVVGEELALLAGLAVFGLAAREAADLGDQVNEIFSSAMANLAHGELLDVERAFDVDFSPADYDELIRHKTGELFRLSCQLGGLAGGQPADQIAILAMFGLRLGAAFQILDDTLDFRLDNDKSAGTDHLLGLFGAPTLCALRADRSGRLAALLLDPHFDVDSLPGVRAMVDSLGGLRAATVMADAGHRAALDQLDRLSDPDLRDRLAEVVRLEWRGLT